MSRSTPMVALSGTSMLDSPRIRSFLSTRPDGL
jgi:hypothetical protein